MNNVDKQYLDLLKDILENGVEKDTRAGKVKSVFGRMMRFNLKEGLPLLTTKKVYTKGIIHELLWFLKGNTNIKYLIENNVNIWTDDAYRYYCELINKNNQITKEMFPEDKSSQQVTLLKKVSKEEFIQNVLEEKEIKIITDKLFFFPTEEGNTSERFVNYNTNYKFGDLGPVYGRQWRSFGISGFDQIKNIIETLKNNPDDRRMLCVAFNPDVLGEVALPPCHVMFQFYTKELENGRRELSCSFTMRSNDFCTGNPYNLGSYGLLAYMIAEVCDMEVGELIYNGGDVHVYLNHLEGALEQLSRNGSDKIPQLKFARKIDNIDDFKYEDFIIEDYEPDLPIKYQLNVG